MDHGEDRRPCVCNAGRRPLPIPKDVLGSAMLLSPPRSCDAGLRLPAGPLGVGARRVGARRVVALPVVALPVVTLLVVAVGARLVNALVNPLVAAVILRRG